MREASVQVRLARGAADMDRVRGLCRQYRALLAERATPMPEIVENYYNEEGYEAFLRELPRLHARPDGAMFLADLDGAAVGCGMTYRIAPGVCEVKRIFVSDAARGRGAAQALFHAAMAQARDDGFRVMTLDTMIWLTEAIALYAKLGFAPCDPFYDPDPRFAPYIRFFRIDL